MTTLGFIQQNKVVFGISISAIAIVLLIVIFTMGAKPTKTFEQSTGSQNDTGENATGGNSTPPQNNPPASGNQNGTNGSTFSSAMAAVLAKEVYDNIASTWGYLTLTATKMTTVNKLAALPDSDLKQVANIYLQTYSQSLSSGLAFWCSNCQTRDAVRNRLAYL
jgi:hypothetical protein